MSHTRAKLVALAALALLVAVAVWWRGRSRAPAPSAGVAASSSGRARLIRAGGEVAKGSGAIDGQVVDPQGAPAGGAQLVLSRELFADDPEGEAGVTAVARADAGGRFRFGDLAAGRYRLTAASAQPGFAPAISEEVRLASGQTHTLQLRLGAEGAAVHGRVFDSGGGPLSGATLTAVALPERREAFAPPFALVRTTSDPSGGYRLHLHRGKYALLVQADGYVDGTATLELEGDISRDFRLDPAASISGRVLDRGSGQPVAGAAVTASMVGRAIFSSAGPDPGVTTDAAGAFRIVGLAPGDYQLTARRDHLVGASDELRLAPAQTLESVTILCDRSFSVSGRVRPPDGTALTEAWVSARGERFSEPDVSGGQVDDAGAFRLSGLLPGRYELSVTVIGGGRGETFVRVTDRDLTGVTIQLDAGHLVSGLVLDPAGRPVANARVSVNVRLTSIRSGGAGGVTDGDGRFGIHVEKGTVSVHALHPAIGSASWGPRPLAEAVAGPIRLQLAAGAMVTGQVRFEGGKPASGATVRTLISDRLGGMISAEAVAGADGRYSLRGLPPGEIALSPRAPDSLRAREQAPTLVTLAEGEQKRVDLQIASPRTVRGKVLLPDGRPAAGASVTVVPGEAVGPGSDAARTTTDGDGNFMVEELDPDDRYSLWAHLAGYGDAQAEGVPAGPADNLVLRLSAESSLAGVVVHASGKPVTDYQLQLSRTDGGDRGRRRYVAASALGLRAHGSVRDPAGAFRLPGLTPGAYELQVVATGGHSGRLSVTVAAGEHRRDLRIQLQAGLTVRGRLVDAESGRPLAGVTVRAGGREGLESGADGTFTLTGVARTEGLSLHFEIEGAGYHLEPEPLSAPSDATVLDVGTLRFLKGDLHAKVAGGPPGIWGFSFDLDGGNLVLTRVFPKLPAESAGLQPGDWVVAIDGQRLAGLSAGSRSYLLRGKIGTSATLTVKAAGRERTLTLVRVTPAGL